MKTKLLPMITLLCLSSLISLSNDPDHLILEEKGYTAYLKSSVFMWKQIVAEAEKIYESSEKTTDDLYKLTNLQYGLLYTCLASQDKETHKSFNEQASDNAALLVEKAPLCSKYHALHAAFMSIEMGFYPMKGMTLGSKSGISINTAIEKDSTNAFAWKQYASSKYFTPEMFGGDLSKAITAYEKTIGLYELGEVKNCWNYLDALAWLGIAYSKAGMKDKAIAIYEKALTVEPEFTWISEHLLPSAKKQAQNEGEE